jgi:hypothetical protein
MLALAPLIKSNFLCFMGPFVGCFRLVNECPQIPCPAKGQKVAHFTRLFKARAP